MYFRNWLVFCHTLVLVHCTRGPLNLVAKETIRSHSFSEIHTLFSQMGMEVDPDYGEVFFNYGNLLSDVGEYEKAIPMYVHHHTPLVMM